MTELPRLDRARTALDARLVAAVVGTLTACGARTELSDGLGGAGPLDVASASISGASSTSGQGPAASGATSAATSSSSGVVLVQCACPDATGYVPCSAPLMCCACNDDGLGWTVDRCEDPETFNCTCSDPLMCPE